LRAEYHVDFRHTQFPLHPDTPDEGLSTAQLFAGRSFDIDAVHDRLARLMAEEGLPFNQPAMIYNSRLAQELAKWAETQDGGAGIHDALYRAYFVDGLNLARIDTLAAVVRQLGLPEADARDALSSRRFRDAVDADWRRSRSMGVTSVPTFVVGRNGVVGAQPYEVLEQAVVEAGAEKRYPPSREPPP
jgi:predicted DsbA family dithiol-disulfide isomerase